jgi:diguanylate cyclase
MCRFIVAERRQEMDAVAEIAKKVILAMARHKVPMRPDNYCVWFEGLTGQNEALSQELARYQESGVEFTEELNRELYEKYFGQQGSRKLLREISQEAGQLLREFLEKLVSSDEATEEYAVKLRQYMGRLEEVSHEPGELKRLLKDLALATGKMEGVVSELRKELERARARSDELQRMLQDARRQAVRDVLTGLYNRRYLEEKLRSLHREFLQKNVPFSVILLDIDHFKKINDTYGHTVGDGVLEFIGAVLKRMVKGSDVPARYGGEEFAILLPLTTREGACVLAENIRKEICSKNLKIKNRQERIGVVTISLGVAQVSRKDTAETLVERADRALYLAKVSGRNQVKSEKDLEAEGPIPLGVTQARRGFEEGSPPRVGEPERRAAS